MAGISIYGAATSMSSALSGPKVGSESRVARSIGHWIETQRHQLKPRRVQNPVPAEAMGGVWWHHRNDIAAMSAS